MPKVEVTYLPDNAIRDGYIKCWADMLSSLLDSRWLIQQLFVRDIKSVYKQSFLGIFWVLIVPLIALATFIVLNSSGIFSLGDINVPYPIFAILGLSFWQIFSAGLISASNSITSAGVMIKKINFPKESLVFASIAQALIAFAIQVLVVSILFVYYGYRPSACVVLMPLMTVPIILLTLGLGFLFSLVNGVTRDLEKVIGPVMTFMMFITPIMYAKPKLGLLEAFTRYNPLYYLVSVPRDLILTGHLTEPIGYALSAMLSLSLFLACWRVFYLTETRVTERV